MNTYKDFLKDIGLHSVSAELKAQPKPNLLTFISKNSMRMDDPRTAVYVHMKNMLRTYGKDVLTEALAVISTEIENENE